MTSTLFIRNQELATLGLLKIKLLWNKGYDVIVSVLDVTNKLLSSESNYIVEVVKWPKLGSSSISFTEVIYDHINFITIEPEKPICLSGALGSSSFFLDWHSV